MFKKIFLLSVLVTMSIYPQSTSEEFATKFEKSDYLETESYQETMDYFYKIASASPYAEFVQFGKSPQGRALICLIVNKKGNFSPQSVRESGTAVVMIQSGIHAGEICGKDANMLLLREILITKEKIDLLENLTLIVIPIFNVDGHERMSPYNRINQNGPAEMGWRTTAQNYNLNRDYMKADTPEMKALLKLYSEWLPDLYIDIHATDGADFQYTVTYNIQRYKNLHQETADWIRKEYVPYVEKYVKDRGYLISPYLSYVKRDFRNGVQDWIATPRFSNGYSILQNRPSMLIETHMLKPYKDRVFSAKHLVEAALRIVGRDSGSLVRMNRDADREAIQKYGVAHEKYPYKLKLTQQSDKFNYLGYKPEFRESPITGVSYKTYSEEQVDVEVPYFHYSEVIDHLSVPSGYIIPRQFTDFAERLRLHGVKVDIISEAKKVYVEKIKFTSVKFPGYPYENHFRPSYEFATEKDTVSIDAGSYYVSTNQRTVGIIVSLLEPKSDESFVKWGMMNFIFERKEYFEAYSMAPIAEGMIKENPKLHAEFQDKLESDEKFSGNMYARLNFWYKKSPYFDERYFVYPILRVIEN